MPEFGQRCKSELVRKCNLKRMALEQLDIKVGKQSIYITLTSSVKMYSKSITD